jgi:hypothetical protein
MEGDRDGLTSNPDQYRALLLEACVVRDAAAAVFYYDKIRQTHGEIDDTIKAQLIQLERLRDVRPLRTLPIPPDDRRRALQPARRIHKICKGWRRRESNEAGEQYLEAAQRWIEEEREAGRECDARSSTSARIALARRMKAALGIPTMALARSLVTRLKQKRCL